MLESATFKKIYIKSGYTDLRLGIDGLSAIISQEYQLNVFDKDVLFLFCGRRSDRIKGLLWEGDGFLLLYKRIENGRFQWPRGPSSPSSAPRTATPASPPCPTPTACGRWAISRWNT